MNFQSMTIQRKLYLSYGFMVCLALGMGVASISILRSLAQATKALGVTAATRLADVGVLNGSTAEVVISERSLLMSTLSKDRSEIDYDASHYVENEALSRKSIEDMRSFGVGPKEGVLLDALVAELDRAAPLYASFLAQVRAGHAKEALEADKAGLRASLMKSDNSEADLLTLEHEGMAAANAESQGEVLRGHWMMIGFVGVCMAMAVVATFVIRDLSVRLRMSVLELTEAAEQIGSAAGQVSVSSQSLAQGASEQAATIEETSSASGEISSMARRTADNSQQATEIVGRSQESFGETNTSLKQMVEAMDGISGSSEKISKIIKVIDEIAFQTNILALNAAVEAARAGEAGMGFAVVADEVRNLAQRCAQAAKDTADLIEESIGRSASGQQKLGQVTASIRKVTDEAGTIKVLVEEISLGSGEQMRGIEQIARAITQMEQVTQSTAASAEEGAAAAEELNAQAATMQEVVIRLRAMVVAPGASSAGGGSLRLASRMA